MQQKKNGQETEMIWEIQEDEESRKKQELRRHRQRQQRRRKRRRQVLFVRTLVGLAAVCACLALGVCLWKLGSHIWRWEETAAIREAQQAQEQLILKNRSEKPQLTEDFLTPNEYSRPGEKLPEVTELFVHYTANAGTSAAQNKSYFENLAVTGETSASSHFIIGYDGEIIQCLPLEEIGYAVKEHNYNSISIECCYQDADGKFTDATRQSLIRLLGWLMREYELGPSAVLRHYDAGGKPCPLYYVEHEEAWEALLEDLTNYIEAP